MSEASSWGVGAARRVEAVYILAGLSVGAAAVVLPRAACIHIPLRGGRSGTHSSAEDGAGDTTWLIGLQMLAAAATYCRARLAPAWGAREAVLLTAASLAPPVLFGPYSTLQRTVVALIHAPLLAAAACDACTQLDHGLE
eukprot:TRINITY_DN28331_c0_g1_i1.p2 TRINITY_DN28331_c0_g1~~TRINITY_DN28331_c0_g1_i1.p2  ORF type:complete len:153 (+),score=21.24 TRINITY_DN28331_c0_g1_i1:40-459(+)